MTITTLLYFAPRLSLLTATFSALALSRSLPAHQPIARLLFALLALDVARLGTASALDGWRWVVDVGLTAGWYVGLTAGVWGVLSGGGRRV